MDELQKYFNDQETKEVISNPVINCSICKNTDIFNDTAKGNLICNNCGTILSEMLDTTAEWRYYNSDDSKSMDPSRCGCPVNPYLPKSSLGTLIASKNINLTRIHQWNSMPYTERSLLSVFDDITTRCHKNNIPKSVIDDAIFYYKKIHDSKVITRGAIRKGIKAACVLIACQKKKISMVPNDIAKIFDVKSTDITRGCKKFYELIGNIDALSEIENLNSDDYVQRFCKKLKINKKYSDIAKTVAQKTEELNITCENTPPSIAAGSILLVCTTLNLLIGKKQVAVSCNISEVTITKTYRKLLPYKEQLLPSTEYINSINENNTIETAIQVKLYDLS